MRSRIIHWIMFLVFVPVLGFSANYYVSPSGDNTNDGSLTNPWKTIQYAINTAIVVSGDTINVAAGTYNERIFITKGLTFLGATHGVSKKGYVVPSGYAFDNTSESIITPSTDSAGGLVFIRADNVTLDGFIVCNMVNDGGGNRELVYFDQQNMAYLNVKIVNNIIGPSTNTTAQDGTKGRGGIVVAGPCNTRRKLYVANNKIFDCKGDGCGIMFVGSVGIKNVNNSVNSTSTFAGTIIENNEITGNHRSGIELAGGIQGGANPEDHVIIRNNIISNSGWGVATEDAALKYGNGIVMQRVGSDCTFDDAHGCWYLNIVENTITGNEKNGIYMGPVQRDVYIKGNHISNNGAGLGTSTWGGVFVDLNESYYPTPKNVTFSAGDVWAPGGPYAYATTILMNVCTTYSQLSNIRIQGNNFQGNTAYGVKVSNQPDLGNVVATYDYWGAADGPSPLGSGNAVSNYVDYIPFSSAFCKTGNAVITGGSTVVDVIDEDITFDFTGGSTGTGGDFAVGVMYTTATGSYLGGTLSAANTLKKTWGLLSDMSGFTVTLIFKYEDADVPAGVNEANLIPLRSTDGGVTWEAVTGTVTHDTVNNTLTVAGVTAFSLWTFADSGMVPIELSDFAVE
jgi:hypothetical protein